MTDPSASRLADVISRSRSEIERRWLARVQADLAETPEVTLTQLRDGIPDYLRALVRLLREEPHDLDPKGNAAWTVVAREHGITRVRTGFDINQLVHEFIVLRQMIRQVAIEQGMGAEELAAARLADILESAIAAAVRAYVDARDFELRRVQAENIGFLTHELRNPLSTAMLSAATLREVAGAEHAKLFDTLDRALRRLAGLIEGVLLTEQLEAGQVEARPQPTEIAGLLRGALENARLAAQRKGIDFKISVDPKLRASVDPHLTRSAVQNLADNAVKYTDEGGVDIHVEDRDPDLVIHVRDTCHGMSPEELRIIFEPFRRGRTRQAGTGLGLSIAKRAVEVQHGRIEVESSQEVGGCHFWITLPKRPRVETQQEGAQAAR